MRTTPLEFTTAEGEALPGPNSPIAAEPMLMTVTGNIPAVLMPTRYILKFF